MLLGMLSHHVGWPLIEGGSQKLADAMVTALEEQGGEVVTGHQVTDLREFDGVPAVLLDTTPEAFVSMAGDRVNEGYRRWVSRYHHGAGVFKIDWILSEPVPWTNPDVRRAGTLHVAGNLDETIAGERAPNQGRLTDKPYVLAVQPTVPDPTRAPDGGHIFWAYVHVPHGSDVDMTEAIENQIERFAPGFRDTVVERVHEDRRPDGGSGTPATSAATSPTARRRCGRCSPARCPAGTPTRRRCRASTSPPPRPRPGPRCTGRAGTTPRRSRCARCSASGTVPPLRPATR